MPTIRSGDGTVTHINVFRESPARQQELVRSLEETVVEASPVKEWPSASIHQSLDRTRVVNYVQFQSTAAAQAVTQHLLSRRLIQRNAAIAAHRANR